MPFSAPSFHSLGYPPPLSSPIFLSPKGHTSAGLQAWAERQEIRGVSGLGCWCSGALESQVSNKFTKEAAAWVLLGESSSTLWTRSTLAEGWARSRANCWGRRKDVPCPPPNSFQQDQSPGTSNREGILWGQTPIQLGSGNGKILSLGAKR